MNKDKWTIDGKRIAFAGFLVLIGFISYWMNRRFMNTYINTDLKTNVLEIFLSRAYFF